MNIRLFILGMAFLAVTPCLAAAAFYRYYDENGVINVTNDYKSVPERYRSKVIVVTEQELQRRSQPLGHQQRAPVVQRPGGTAPAAPQAVPAAPASVQPAVPPQAPGGSWINRQVPMLKIIGTFALLAAAFMTISRLVSKLASRALATVIRIGLLAALAVYLLKGMAGRIPEAFDRIRYDAGVAQKAVDRRSEKIRQQVE